MRELKMQLDHANTSMKKKLYRHYLKKDMDLQRQKQPFNELEMEDIQDFKDLMRGQTKLVNMKREKLERVTKTIELLNNSFGKKQTDQSTSQNKLQAIQEAHTFDGRQQKNQLAISNQSHYQNQPHEVTVNLSSFFQKRPNGSKQQMATLFGSSKKMRPQTAIAV